MQKIFLSILTLAFLSDLSGQKTEISGSINSGLFSFSGTSAANSSSINYSDAQHSGYTNNPYGSRAGLCNGLSATIKKVGKKNFILGIDLGYETLRSKVEIVAVSGYTGISAYQYLAKGQTFLNFSFINLFPQIGYRIPVKKISLDVTGGFDIAWCLNATERGKATANGTKYMTNVDRKTIRADVRPRIQLSAANNKAGIYMGYSYGAVSYLSGFDGGANECYAQLLRFGFTYRLK